MAHQTIWLTTRNKRCLKNSMPIQKKKIMKFKCCTILLIFVVAGTLCLSSAAAQDKELALLIEKITVRIESYSNDKNWKATCLEKESKMNKQWQPEETRTTKSIAKVLGGEENLEILEAIEIKDGKTKDVTKEAIKQAEETREKMKKSAAKKNKKNKEGDKIADLFPFARDQREKYNFKKLDDAVLDGAPVFLIEAMPKEKDEKLLDGKYYIDQKTFDVLRIQGKPSKIPMIVDEIEMEMVFKVLPENVLVMKSTKMKASAGILGMHIRQLAEVEYSDFQILPSDSR